MAADAVAGVNGHQRLRLWWVSTLVVVFGLGATLMSAWHEAETADEPTHFEWSRRLLDERVTERRSNEYFESKAPVSMLNVVARRVARRVMRLVSGPPSPPTLLFAARLSTVALFALLLGTVFLAARAWVGSRAAHLATIACALDPNLIAHGGLVTVDVAFALFHLLTLCAAYALVRRPSVGRGVLLGLAAGLAFATKFSAVLLIPGAALALFALNARAAFARQVLGRVAAGLIAAASVATLTICAAYLFVGVGLPLSAIGWDSALMVKIQHLVPGLRLPLPADFLTGFDLSLARERGLKWRVVILGREYPRGVWYYFALLWLMKTPLLVLLAQVTGYLQAVRTGLLWRQPPLRFLGLNLALLLAYFSLLFHAQIGYRFVLMCLPMGYIIGAAGLASIEPSRRVRLLGVIVVLVAVGENAAYCGNHIAFTNLAVQPKKLVFRWITHSNVDWYQNEDEVRIEGYLARAGIGRERLNPPHLLLGRSLLRHSHAAGNLHFERYRWVRENLEPIRHFDHTFLLFDVRAAEFERLIEESRRVAPSALGSRLCPPGELYPQLGPEQPMALTDDQNPRNAWLVCVDAPQGADLVWHATAGSAVVGPAGALRPDFVEAEQEVWYRLEPGRHAFSVGGLDGVAGTWRTQRGAISLAFRRPGDP